MAKFAINKDFDHAKAKVFNTNHLLEIIRLDRDSFGVVLYRDGNKPEDLAEFSLEELRAIHYIISQ